MKTKPCGQVSNVLFSRLIETGLLFVSPHGEMKHKVISIAARVRANITLERLADAVLAHMKPKKNVIRERYQTIFTSELAANARRIRLEPMFLGTN